MASRAMVRPPLRLVRQRLPSHRRRRRLRPPVQAHRLRHGKRRGGPRQCKEPLRCLRRGHRCRQHPRNLQLGRRQALIVRSHMVAICPWQARGCLPRLPCTLHHLLIRGSARTRKPDHQENPQLKGELPNLAHLPRLKLGHRPFPCMYRPATNPRLVLHMRKVRCLLNRGRQCRPGKACRRCICRAHNSRHLVLLFHSYQTRELRAIRTHLPIQGCTTLRVCRTTRQCPQ